MKISELLKSGSISRAMQIPVAIAGENRSLTLGQIIDALSTAIVPFAGIAPDNYTFTQVTNGASSMTLPIVFHDGRFYALLETSATVSGVGRKQAVFYTAFPGMKMFYGDDGKVRTDCLFIGMDGRLYRHNGTTLVSAGITAEQAQQIKLLTPIPVDNEGALQAMEQAGLIVPGQMYYIPEND